MKLFLKNVILSVTAQSSNYCLMKRWKIRGIHLESTIASEKVNTEVKEPVHSNQLKLTFEMLPP